MLSSIEAERVRKQMSKEDLSSKLGVSLKTYYNWISEETDIPCSALIKLREIFCKDIDYLVEGSIHTSGTAV